MMMVVFSAVSYNETQPDPDQVGVHNFIIGSQNWTEIKGSWFCVTQLIKERQRVQFGL